MIYIKKSKITIIGHNLKLPRKDDYGVLSRYDDFGVQQKIIDVDEESLYCMVYFKENNTIIAGGWNGNIIIYRIQDFRELKRYKFHNCKIKFNIVKTVFCIAQLKGYNGLNDIFASCGGDHKIFIWDYDGNILKVVNTEKMEKIDMNSTLTYSVSTNMILYTCCTNNLYSALKILDLNQDEGSKKEFKSYKFHEFFSKIRTVLLVSNFLNMEMLITCTESSKYIPEQIKPDSKEDIPKDTRLRKIYEAKKKKSQKNCKRN